MIHSADLWLSLPVPGLILDGDDCILEANPAAEGVLNNSSKTLLGKTLWPMILSQTDVPRAVQAARQGQHPLYINEVTLSAPHITEMSCALHCAPFGAEAGHMLLVLSTRPRAGHVTGAEAADKAAKSAIGMAEMLAHEIKNPLAGITGAAQLLAMSLGEGERDLTDLIVGESRRILALLQQVEGFGDHSPPDLVPCNLHDVLERARQSAELGSAANMRILSDYDPSLPPALADPDQLMQVFANLMRNAAEAAGPEGGTITLHTYFEHGYRLRRAGAEGGSLPLQIEVIDDGPGLPEAIAAHIFDPFVSGRVNGTGLGLALVSKIVAGHGGLITHDRRGDMTVFRLSLPMARGAAER